MKSQSARVLSIGSGKGGVGKTLSTVNLAIAAKRMGHSVLILDADLGMANVDVVLGLKARFNIADVLDGTVSLADIILVGPMGIEVLPSGSGLQRLTQLTELERWQLIEQIAAFQKSYDIVLIDTGAGISPSVLHFNGIAQEVLVVTTPEPHAMTDAYAFIKVMAEQYPKKEFSLLVNMARSEDEGLKVGQRIAEVCAKFLDTRIRILGSVPFDPQLQRSVMLRRAASEQSTFTLAGQAWNRIARQIWHDRSVGSPVSTGVGEQSFWRELISPASGERGAT